MIFLKLLKDERFRKTVIYIIGGLIVTLILFFLMLFSLLKSPLDLLQSLIANPEMWGIVEEFRGQYGSLVNGRPQMSNGQYQWPVSRDFPITSYFGPRDDQPAGGSSNHGAVDIGTPVGTPVSCMGNGTVIFAKMGWNGGYGNLVEVDVGNGLIAQYAHLSEVLVSEGQQVQKGQIVALTGNSGISSGPHLHFGLLLNGEKIDPLAFFESNEVDLTANELLYRCVMAEAGGESFEGIMAVTQCILYTASRKGITTDEVILAPGQYECVENGLIDRVEVSPIVKSAVDEACRGNYVLPWGTEYYYAPGTVSSAWHESLTYVGTIGGHRFFMAP